MSEQTPIDGAWFEEDSGRGWGRDSDLLEALADGLTAAAPEAPGSARGRDAWVLHDLESQLDLAPAELVYDSTADPHLAGVRREGDDQQSLSFDGPDGLGLDLHLSATAMVGQLLPPGAGEVVITTGSGVTTTVTADDLGCFESSRPVGLFRVSARPAEGGGSGITTPWLRA